MANDLVPYGEYWPERWDPKQATRLFDGMIIGGTIGTGIGIATNNHPLTAASVANTGAGIIGKIILALFGYEG